MAPGYGKRVGVLRQAFGEKGLDGVLVNSINDIYYYTGKSPSGYDSAFLLVTKSDRTLFVSGLDNELEGPGVRVLEKFSLLKKELKGMKLGYDECNLSVRTFRKLRSGPWKPFSEGIKSPRMVKDSHEIAQLREAARRTLRILGSLRPRGRTEFQVATEVLHRIRMMGDTPAFEPLVLSGRNAAYAHHAPGRSRVSSGLAMVDMGVRHNMYNADVTRAFRIRPGREEERMLEECRMIQGRLIDMVRPGIRFSSIEKEHEKQVKSLGYPVLHSFGHGIGLGVHERPSGRDVLERGMVLTVEPGIYKKGVGGCRVEDMVLVGERPSILSG